jgi:hypothetical protein
LQDFEALTPNLLARTVETVEGGGIVIMLLSNLCSLTQLYTLTMDVHARLRTDAHQTVTGEQAGPVMCSKEQQPPPKQQQLFVLVSAYTHLSPRVSRLASCPLSLQGVLMSA